MLVAGLVSKCSRVPAAWLSSWLLSASVQSVGIMQCCQLPAWDTGRMAGLAVPLPGPRVFRAWQTLSGQTCMHNKQQDPARAYILRLCIVARKTMYPLLSLHCTKIPSWVAYGAGEGDGCRQRVWRDCRGLFGVAAGRPSAGGPQSHITHSNIATT